MDRLDLNFHGVKGCIESDDPAVLEELRRDFEYFSARRDIPLFHIRLHRTASRRVRIPQVRASFCGAHYVAYDTGPTRTVDYHGAAAVVYDYHAETGEVYCEDKDFLRELGYLLVSSRAGYRLDLKGLHRVHALGLAYEGRGVLLLLPSGGGKSTLCIDLLRASEVRLLSEDTPLVSRDGRLLPFPLRLGFSPREDLSQVPKGLRRRMRRRQFGEKILVDASYFRDSLSGPVPPRLVVVGARSGEARPRVRRCWRAAGMPALFSSLIVGWGTPQLAEYMRPQNITQASRLAAIAASRIAAAALLLRCPVVALTLGTDRAANAEALLKLIAKNSFRDIDEV